MLRQTVFDLLNVVSPLLLLGRQFAVRDLVLIEALLCCHLLFDVRHAIAVAVDIGSHPSLTLQ